MRKSVTIAYVSNFDKSPFEVVRGDKNIFSCFYPIALMARIFGLFPLDNLKSVNPSKLKFSSSLRLLTLSFGVLLIVEMTFYLYRRFLVDTENTEHLLQILTKFLDRIVGVAIYPVIWFRSQRYVGYFQKWQLSNNLFQADTLVNTRKVGILYLTFWLIAIVLSMLVIVVLEDFTYEFLPGGLVVVVLVYPIAVASRIISIVAFYYVDVFYATMAIYLYIGFDQVASGLRIVLKNSENEKDVAERVRKLRFVHQDLYDLVEETNGLLTPMLVINLSTQTIILCSLIYRMIVYKSDLLPFVARGLYSLVRALMLLSLCVAGGKLSDSSRNGLKEIYNAPLVFLSPESRFQIHMLEAKMSNRKAVLNASGFADVDRSLLLQIVGVVVTYVLVMVQFKEDG